MLLVYKLMLSQPLRGLSGVQYQFKMKSYNSEKKLHELHCHEYSTTTLSNVHTSDRKNVLSHLFLSQLLFSKLDFFFPFSLSTSSALQHTTKKGKKKYIQARVKPLSRHICQDSLQQNTDIYVIYLNCSEIRSSHRRARQTCIPVF